jgi:NADH-quinone oxidoreductase subunit N
MTLLPFATLTIAAVAVLLYGVLTPRATSAQVAAWAQRGLGVTALATLPSWLLRHPASFNGMLYFNYAALWFTYVFLIATSVAVCLAAEHLDTGAADHREVHALLLLSCLGMMVMAAGGNLVMIFIGLETMSVTLYVLAALAGLREEGSNEAALKYLLLGGFATGFLVYGMAFLYGATGTLDLQRMQLIIGDKQYQSGYLMLGFALVTVGLGFKVALVPFHMWAPDVYEGAPTPITAFMAVGPKVAGFAAMLRIFSFAGVAAAPVWGPPLAALAVLTMLVGNLAALAQTNIKRLLAFSAIAHAGYLALGVVAGTRDGVQAVLYYGATYAFLSLAAFAVVLVVHGPHNDRLDISELAGLSRRSPFLAGCLALALIGMAGLPPLSGFVGKWLLFMAAVRQGYVVTAALGILCSAISVFYYFRLIRLMYMEEPAAEAPALVIPPLTRQVLLGTLIGTVLLSIPVAVAFVPLAGWCAGILG